MSARTPGKKKKTPGEKSEDSFFDLIQPDDSLPEVSEGSGAQDPAAGFDADFGGDFSAPPDEGAEASAPPEDEGRQLIPGLDPPLADSELEELGIPSTGKSAEEITNAFNTLLRPDSGESAPAPEPELEPEPEPDSIDADLGPGSTSDSLTKTVPSTLDAAQPMPAAIAGPGPTIENVKRFSNQLSSGKTDIAAAYPFSLLITGRLRPEEREKLLDLLTRADVGIREPDLEPQFELGKILIPRISEYAGVMIVQALRAASVQFRLGPSDSIFATDDTRSTEDEKLPPSQDSGATSGRPSVDSRHDADSLPVTADASLPQFPHARVIDLVTASAAISTSAVEAERSSEYIELLESLQRELKYKAYRKGAQAIVAYTANLTALTSPARYRLTLSGSAIGTHDDGSLGPAEPLDFGSEKSF